MKMLILMSVFIIGGCSVFSKEPKHNLDVKNSPCACIYDGEQILMDPNEQIRSEIYRELRG